MLRKAIILSFLYYAFAVVLSGCCNCPPARTIQLTNLYLSSRSYTVDADSILRSAPYDGTDFRDKNYCLHATMGYEFIASDCSHLHAPMNQAYACKCDEATANVQVPIKSFRVFTVNDYDATHAAGSEITDRFGSPLIVNGKFMGIGPLELFLPTYQYIGVYPYTSYDLYMASRPDSGTSQQFRVLATLYDSTSFTALTPVLLF